MDRNHIANTLRAAARALSGEAELHLFDFDGTLFRSPDPPEWWPWPGGTKWWSWEESLTEPCVPERPGREWWNGPIVQQAKKSIKDQNVYAMLATGRIDAVFRWRVPELLKLAGLSFDEVHMSPGGATLTFKTNLVKRILRRHPAIGAVHIWDDRKEHLRGFEAALAPFVSVSLHPVSVKAKPAECDISILAERGALKPPSKVAFLQAVLTPASQKALLRAFPAAHGKTHAHHMTVLVKPSPDKVRKLAGREVKLRVVGYAQDDKGQAVVVKSMLQTDRPIPHITISTASGTGAKYSNELLADGYKAIKGPTLTAILDTDPSQFFPA